MKKITYFILIAAVCVVFLPAQSAASTDNKSSSTSLISGTNLILQQGRGRGKNNRYWDDRGRRRNGTWYGYRNYGQYRRTQVGNRRYRWARRPYRTDRGIVYRLTRIFY